MARAPARGRTRVEAEAAREDESEEEGAAIVIVGIRATEAPIIALLIAIENSSRKKEGDCLLSVLVSMLAR